MIKLYRPVKGVRNIDWRLTQQYGVNATYYKTIGRPYHLGLDYSGPSSGDKSAVFASEDGVVTGAGRDTSGFGNLVKISGNSGVTYYAHLSSILCSIGQTIKANTLIGYMGETGNSKGVHLHFGRKPADPKLRNWKDRGDPTPYISDREKKQPPEYQNLIDDGLFNGDITGLNEREMTIMGRIYAKCKK